jgi:hypothetical protein
VDWRVCDDRDTGEAGASGEVGFGGGCSRWRALARTTDQKVRGSSPFGRAGHMSEFPLGTRPWVSVRVSLVGWSVAVRYVAPGSVLLGAESAWVGQVSWHAV